MDTPTVDRAKIAAARDALNTAGVDIFRQVADRPPPKVGKPLVAAISKVSAAVDILNKWLEDNP